MKNIKALFSSAAKRFSDANAHDLGGALAYFAVFSLIPLISVLVLIAGSVLGKDLILNQIIGAVQSSVGPDAATLLQSGLLATSQGNSDLLVSIISGAVLIVGVIVITTQLQESLDRILCKEIRKVPFLKMIREKIASFSIVFLLSFLLLAFLLVSAGISFFATIFTSFIPFSFIYLRILNVALNFIFVFAFCFINFKYLPNIVIRTRSVMYGSLVTGILFIIGKFILGLYLAYSNPGTAFGAAGALLVLLIWIYYSSQILFFGACFAYATEHQT